MSSRSLGMSLSDNGLNLICKFEAFRSTIYKDEGGLDTIGYGHLIRNDEVFDSPITEEQGKELLKQDVQIAENAINYNVHVSLNQNQFDALCSFVYNIGLGNFVTSHLHTYIEEQNFEAAANEFPKWNKVKGQISAILTQRRGIEQALFLSKEGI